MGNKLLVPRILWFALFVSTLIYVYVLDVTPPKGESTWEPISTFMTVAAVVSGLASLFGPRLLVKPASKSKAANATPMNQYQVGLILAMALAEAVAIYGMILGFRGAPNSVVLPYFIAAWVLMLIRFPTESKLAQFE